MDMDRKFEMSECEHDDNGHLICPEKDDTLRKFSDDNYAEDTDRIDGLNVQKRDRPDGTAFVV